MFKVGDYVKINSNTHNGCKGLIRYFTPSGIPVVEVLGLCNPQSLRYLERELEPWVEPEAVKTKMTVELALELCDIEAALELVNDHKGYAFDQNDQVKSKVYSLTYVTLKTRYNEIMEMFR